VGVEKRREKVENSTIRGQHSEPSADRSPSTESDETRRSDGATRRPPGQKISSRSDERFGRRGRRRGTTRRARRQKEQSTRAARRRTRRRRGTDARNSRQHGERRVDKTEQKKNRENRRRRSKVIDDSASVKKRVRSKTSARRLRRPRAAALGGGGRRGSQRQSWRSGQNVGLWCRRCQVRFRGRTFLLFFRNRGVRRKRNVADVTTFTHSRCRRSIRVRCRKLNTRLAATDGKAVLQRVAAVARRRRREK
jgi:hypothetical protein